MAGTLSLPISYLLADAFGRIMLPVHATLVPEWNAVLTWLVVGPFAIVLASEYADVASNGALRDLLREKAIAWYANDAGCQAWEPSGDDFLSPALIEAECLRRVLGTAEFDAWLSRFLPRIGQREQRDVLAQRE